MARANIEKIESNSRHKFYCVTLEQGAYQARVTVMLRLNASEAEVHKECQKRITGLRQTIKKMETAQ